MPGATDDSPSKISQEVDDLLNEVREMNNIEKKTKQGEKTDTVAKSLKIPIPLMADIEKQADLEEHPIHRELLILIARGLGKKLSDYK